jgi:hypothetical protein
LELGGRRISVWIARPVGVVEESRGYVDNEKEKESGVEPPHSKGRNQTAPTQDAATLTEGGKPA